MADCTDVLSPAVTGSDRSGAAMVMLQLAGAAMKNAASSLSSIEAEEALRSGEAAVEHLELALEVVAAVRGATERQIAKQKLDEIRTMLAELRHEQERVNVETTRIDDHRVQTPPDAADHLDRLTLADAQLLTQLGRQEAWLAERTQTLRERLGDVIVSGWMVGEISARMRGIQRLLELRDTGPTVQREQSDVL
jgi:hypothetical protein